MSYEIGRYDFDISRPCVLKEDEELATKAYVVSEAGPVASCHYEQVELGIRAIDPKPMLPILEIQEPTVTIPTQLGLALDG